MPVQNESEELRLKIDNGHARRMGPIENFFSIWQRQKMYKNFAIIAHFNHDINSDKRLLFSALRSMLLKYPILASTVEKTDYSDLSKPRPIHDYIKVQDSLKLDQLLIDFPQELLDIKDRAEQYKYINTKVYWSYENDDLLWKVGFLDSETLVYITNHCLSDGISGIHFFEDLVELLNNPSLENHDIDLEKDYLFNYNKDHKSLPELPPSIDSVINYTPSLIYMFEYFFNFFVLKNLNYRSRHQPSRDDEFHYKLINIPAEEVSKIKEVLLSNSSKSKLTLTPYIQAVWLRSVNEIVTPLNNPVLGIHDISIPGNARQFLPSSIDSSQFRYGSNTSGIHKFFFPVKKVDFKIIDYFSSYLKYLSDTRKFLSNMGMLTLDFVVQNTNMDKTLFKDLMGSPRNGTLFSNLGLLSVKYESRKKISIDDLVFSANGGASSETFSLSAVSTNKGGLNLLIAVTKDDISEETFDKLVEHFHRGLSSYNDIN